MLKRRQGFTLIELLVAVIIIGLMSSMAVFNYRGMLDNSKNVTVDSNVKIVVISLEKYRTDFGILPVTDLMRTTHRNHIRFASEIGATAYGLVGGGRLRWRPPSDAEYTELAAFCEELALFGEKVGVTVSYHPHTLCTIETSPEIAILMERSSALKLCLDASHIALVGGDFDVLLLVRTSDNKALRELVLTRLQAIPEVLSTRTLLVFEEEDLEPEG